jgi:hypothetical protein
MKLNDEMSVKSWAFGSLIVLALAALAFAAKSGFNQAEIGQLIQKMNQVQNDVKTFVTKTELDKVATDIDLLKETKVAQKDFDLYLLAWAKHCEDQSRTSIELANTLGEIKQHLKSIDEKLSVLK